jgi:S1-C subfamily serine protease
MFRFTLLPALVMALAAVPIAAQAQTEARGLPTLTPLVNEMSPAVVNISVITRSPLEANPLFADPFSRRFFNLPDRPQRQQQSAGSGVIVDGGVPARRPSIYAVNRRRAQTLADLQKAAGGAKGGYSVSLLRGDCSVTIIVR